MATNDTKLTIPKGSYTIAYYWENRPYNLYVWRDIEGNYLGSYFNIVKNTQIKDEVVSFEDLIIDIMVLPNGEYFILDEDELPEPIGYFEEGYVKEALYTLTDTIQELLPKIIIDTTRIIKNT
jgi:predicted RNA-binding protein associated with RNAse of E/G family